MLQAVNNTLLMISMPGGTEWILIILAVLILFGGRKIPEFMRGVGQGMGELQKGLNDVKGKMNVNMDQEPAPAPTPAPSIEASRSAQLPATSTDSRTQA